jgi:DNA-binding XRE family transcriptional regulator
MTAPGDISAKELLAREMRADPIFAAEWRRLAPARAFSLMLLRYRAEHGLSQRGLAAQLGVSQPRIAKLESGEHNPDLDTIVNAVSKLGVEFCLDVAPVGKKSMLITARARRQGTVDRDDVSMVVAAA